MKDLDRRNILKLIAGSATAGALPASIARALSVPAHHRTGTIEDVEHIIILTQENRSFDHYFGTLRGVRGFADPRAVKLSNGKPVWHQPHGTGELLPFRPPVDNLGLTYLTDPPHGWNDTHAAWNHGQHDQWVPNKGIVSMTYHTREDIPYHFALADAFTICDAYHCSLMGPTDPNRYHMWTGWVGNDGQGGGPVITNAEVGYDWMTFPERLEQVGISWKVYQDIGTGLTADGYWGWTSDAYIGNYGDNSLLYFHQYQNAAPGTPLADRAKTGTNINAEGRDPLRLIEAFRQDVSQGKLPQVSWIAAPEAFTEHPNFPADFGAWYISQFIDVLASYPEVFSKTVLLINYDEEGGFFDHMVPPTPAQSPEEGASTVDVSLEIFPGDASHPKAPYGLGMRVPLLVVSPWSKGGWVNSQVFDHTSIIRFIEARFAKSHPELHESNITPWRRAVVGDLTTAFDFRMPQTPLRVNLPDTSAYLPTDLVRQPNYVLSEPSDATMPQQERGVRPARALPYAPQVVGQVHVDDGSFHIHFGNEGRAGLVYHVRSAQGAHAPRCYTVEPHRSLSGTWAVVEQGADRYDLEVHGPNGFLRTFKGGVALDSTRLRVTLDVGPGRMGAILKIDNQGQERVRVKVTDRYAHEHRHLVIEAGRQAPLHWDLDDSHGWYDLLITAEGDELYACELAGHVETGEHSISDPMMGGVRKRRMD
ncbi:MAG: phospholipase C, phosphocholine-specific [Burkholderiales bacterium]|nr:phospholipase C, phosphocholine-specific [Burkholderiales bacterium]